MFGVGSMLGIVYLAVLALVVYALLVVWPASACLGVGLLVIAASVFGLQAVARSPLIAVAQTVGLVERRHGGVMVLALLFVMFAVSIAAWVVCGGGQ